MSELRISEWMVGHAAQSLAAALGGLPVWERPGLLSSTRDVYLFDPDEPGRDHPWLVVWSSNVLLQMMRGVVWHDRPEHCRTWTGDDFTIACRCDVEPT